MKHYFLIILTLTLSNFTLSAPLNTIMTFESTALTHEGVKKQTYFQERFIRDENIVWSERIIPNIVHDEHQHNDDSHDHKHNLNFATAAKWLMRENSKVTFKFVRAEDKQIIEPRDSEYGTLGFDGTWETAYYIIDRSTLKKMTQLKRKSQQGTTWYERKNNEEFTRILWDEKNEIPLTIESGKIDGTSSNKITIAITPTSAQPWKRLDHYQTIAYEDLLD